MPEPWLSAQIQEIRQEAKDTRAEMRAGFAALAAKLESHAEDDRRIADRVLVMETQRSEEAKQATRRGALAGIVTGAVTSVIANALKSVFSKP